MDGTQPVARRTRRQIDLFCIAEISRRKKHKRNRTAALSQSLGGGKSKDNYDNVVALDFDDNDLNVETKGNDNCDGDYANFMKVREAEAVKGGGRVEGIINRKSSSGSYDRVVEEEERHFGSFNLRRDSNLQRKKLEQKKIEIVDIDDSDISDGDVKEKEGGDREGGFVKRKCSSRSCFDGKGAEKGERQFYSVNLRRDSGLQRNTLEQRKIDIIDNDGCNMDDCNISVSDDYEDDGDNVSGGGDDSDSDASNGNDDDDGNSDDTDSDADSDVGDDVNADSVDGGGSQAAGNDASNGNDNDDDGNSDDTDSDVRDDDNADSVYGGGSHAADNDAVLQNNIRTGSIDGSNSYDFGTNGRGLLAVDSNHKLQEMGRGLSGGLKNQKGVSPITSAIKVQNISSNVNNENKDYTSTDPERKQYNGEEFPVKYTGAKFFIINTFCKENLHKSIKYGLWASTPDGNKKLDVGYQEAQKKSGDCPVFLFFSVSSGQFVGLAEMVGPVENGFFRVKWHIIKDIPTSLHKHTLENSDNKLVTESQYIQEVALKNGLQMLKAFKDRSC